MSNGNAITAEKLTKRYGNFTAVDEISFEIKKDCKITWIKIMIK